MTDTPTLPPVHDFGSHLATIAQVTAPKPTPKVFVALCSRDWQVESYTSEFVRNIGRECKCQIVVGYMANDGVARSRNNLAAAFLESDCTHLFFLDNDILGRPADLDRMLEADKDIICGFYPKKQAKLDWVANYFPNEKADARGVVRVRHAGTGFMVITRRVLESMIQQLPHIAYGGDPSPEAKRWDFFPMNAKDGMYKSEDWYFCEMAQSCGFDVFIDTHVQLRHVGKCVYPLQFTLSDEDCIDLFHHRYGIGYDQIRAFIASGEKPPHFMGGHQPRLVRNWPAEFPVGDLHQGAELAGCYDVPEFDKAARTPIVLDIGADVGAFAIWATKRWPGLTLTSYEADIKHHACLVVTLERLLVKHAKENPKLVAVPEPIDGSTVFPDNATVLKVDLEALERDILQVFHSNGRFQSLDFILLKYHDDSVPMMVQMLAGPTHYLHCHQRFGPNRGLLKYINRRLVS